MRGVTYLFAAATVLSAGCFKGDFGNCKVVCATTADCPGELQCSTQGLCSAGGADCTAVMPDADLTMPQPLTVTRTGDGTITSDPAGIDCGTTCTAMFPPLSSVSLMTAPAATSVFEDFSGDCTGTTCALTMDGPKTVAARFALHGAKRWAKQITFSGQDYLDGELEVDAMGNVIAAGSIDDAGTAGLHIIKYSPGDGAVVWEKKIPLGPNFFGFVGGLDSDAMGNVYVCSRFQGNGSTTLGGFNVSGDIFGNILAMRLAAADGNIEWAKTWGGTAQEVCEGIAVSGTDVFVTGYTSSDPSSFDSVTLTGAGVNSAFLVKAATANGTASMGRAFHGNFSMRDIAISGPQVAIAGDFRATPNPVIAGCNLSITGTGVDGMVMAFLTSNLSTQWCIGYGSNTANDDTFTNGIAGVPGGGFVATGSFEGSVLFTGGSGTSLGSLGLFDVFLARYSSTGAHVYSFRYGTAMQEFGQGVDVTSTGDVVMAGTFASAITFGSFPLTGATNDAFVTRLSSGPTPIHQWAIKIGGTASEFVNAVSVDALGTVNLLANWMGMTDVAGEPFTAQSYDAFVASFVR
jgi:hypothetical protein